MLELVMDLSMFASAAQPFSGQAQALVQRPPQGRRTFVLYA